MVAITEWLFTVFIDDGQDLGVAWTAAEPDEATPFTVPCTNTVPRTARVPLQLVAAVFVCRMTSWSEVVSMNDHPVTANVAVVSIAAAVHEIVDPRGTGVLQVTLIPA